MADQGTTKPAPAATSEAAPDAAVLSQQQTVAATGAAADVTSDDAQASPSAKGKEKDTGRTSTDTPQDAATGAASPSTPGNPTCNITLLLPTGARHPYKIDERYLSKRNVEIPELTEDGKRDPFSISIYKLKELILLEWREDWEGKPASPTSIRLIHFGKLLDDKEQLKKYQFSAEAPNVIHMSVRPAEMMEEEEGAKGKTASSGGRTREGGGCCTIL